MVATVDTRWFQNRLADVKLSQRRIARHLGVDPAAVSLMIRGKRKMSAVEAAELARLMSVGVDDVLRHAGIATVEYYEAEGRRSVSALPAPPPAAGGGRNGDRVDSTLELPVPMADGSTATLRVPRTLTKADADRIAALMQALALP